MLKLTILGSGTSQGVPMISCDCRVCTSTDPRDKRLRTSALISSDTTTIAIDAGPDFRTQMLRENVHRLDAILLTHEHKDHIGGLDDVRAFNYTMKQPMSIYATEQVQEAVRKDFNYAFNVTPYPSAPKMELVTISANTPFIIGDLEIEPIPGGHFLLPVMGYRIGDLAYLTDFNSIAQKQIDRLQGVKVLVINALRREKHISHFTLDEALDVASQIGAERTYLTHISHQMGLNEEVERQLPKGVHCAYDGMSIEI